MWHRTQIRNLAIRRSVCNQWLCSWRSKFFLKCISVFISRIFLKQHTTYRTVIWYSLCMFSCDRPLMQHTLPEKQAPSLWCLGLRLRDLQNNSHLPMYVNLLKTMCGCLPIVIVKFCYLKSCVTGKLYLGCLCRNVPEYSSAITRTFTINSVIVVAISHILSAIY